MTPLPPGAVIGILGGGQLGRMMALAAARLGLKVHVYCSDADSPAFAVAAASTSAPYEDETALARFAASVDAVTYEFENVPDAAAALLAARRPLAPAPEILRITQDRVLEKSFVRDQGLAVPDFAAIDTLADLEAAIARIGTPCVLKTRRFGYDGKGQARIQQIEDAAGAFDAIGRAPAILEAFVNFSAEVSVIVARDRTGAMETYDIPRNVHRDGILHTSTVPSGLSPALEAKARAIGCELAAAFNYVGVMAVELFVAGDGLIVNEIAPRVHNSGHWTETACTVSQFEQHIRAVAGWPLARPQRLADVEMTNLIGEEAQNWAKIAAEPGVSLHLYGKADARPGRKMGHMNRILKAKDQ